MATKIIKVSVGENKFNVVDGTGSAVASDDVELTFDLTKVTKLSQLWTAMKKIRDHVKRKCILP